MLSPKRVKHRKQHRGRVPGNSKGGTRVEFGEYGLKTLERGWITNRQLEAARIAMTRKIKRGGKVWINIFPDKPVTAKPAETRMGSDTPRAASRDVLKLLDSAIANAENNHELVADELKIHQAFVDEGPTLKRYRPRALGRATRIRKRTSHMTILLTTKE